LPAKENFGLFRGNTVFLGGSGEVIEFLEWLEGLGAKYRGSCEIWEFFRDFCGFLEWFRNYVNIF
jgi:hypothetical protein